MYQYLLKYFSLYKNLSLPGIGSFNTAFQPAELDFANKTLNAPAYHIQYNNAEPDTTAHFYNYLTKETGLQYEEAVHQLKKFTAQLKDKLDTGEPVKFFGIGVLIKKEEGYSFDADKSINDFFSAITAERVIRQNAEHNVRVGEDDKTSTEMYQQLNQTIVKEERWWIAALVLAFIGIAAIAYHYYSK